MSAPVCLCGHGAGSHSSTRFNCLATTGGTHATRCSCKCYTSAPAAPAAEGPRAVAPCVVCGREMFCPDPANRPDMWACTMWGCSFRHVAPAAALPGAEAGTPTLDEARALADMIELRGHKTANPNYLRAAELLRDYDDECKDAEFWRGEAARFAALISEVRALREDKARLDWLSERAPINIGYEDGGIESDRIEIVQEHGGMNDRQWTALAVAKDLRAAIDAARLASPSPAGAP